MNKFFITLLALASTACALFAGYYYNDFALGRWEKSTVPLTISTPDEPSAPIKLSDKELAAISGTLEKYDSQIERVEIQMDGMKLNSYLTSDSKGEWAMFAMHIDLKDGTQLKTRLTKTARTKISQQIVSSVERAMAIHRKAASEGKPAKIYTNI